ncbi:hypothetical protein, partial [Pseudomonas helleri]|uniref:hypothetical protein n=1 Tax=Pseudomonas helleri TaxID=1608996 RepID=UPI003FD620CB
QLTHQQNSLSHQAAPHITNSFLMKMKHSARSFYNKNIAFNTFTPYSTQPSTLTLLIFKTIRNYFPAAYYIASI